MAYAVGVGLAIFTFVLARFAGVDRERVFYPTILIVIASALLVAFVIGRAGGAARHIEELPA
jgi:hypothetical protein